MEEEKWRYIPGYPKYLVSSHGRVKSFKKDIGKILKPYLREGGYLAFRLYGGKHKKGDQVAVHQLVAMAFLGHVRNGHSVEVDHIDFNKLNNHLSNLRLVTARENSSKKQINKTSKYIGVCFARNKGKFDAKIRHHGKRYWIGYYETEQEARIAYENKLLELDALKS